MSGPQFFHLQSYSRKPNTIGQSVQQILGEAAREPIFSLHVKSPKPPNLIYGITPQQVRKKHDEIVATGYVDAALADGKVARRGIRKDRHTLLTAVASFPRLTEQVADGSTNRQEYERWIELNVRWLKETFGERLVSIVEHVDEKHPHLHAFILPLGDVSCSARHLNPAWQVKEEVEALARQSGKPSKEARKSGNLAYRERGRKLQDEYFNEVGLPAGLTRTGPSRERLSRAQWKERKEQARRNADLHRQMSERVETIANANAQFDADMDRKALEVAEKLNRAEALFEEAEIANRDAELMLERAASESDAIKRQVQVEANNQSTIIQRQADELRSAQSAFEHEKREVIRETVVRAASVTANVLLGVLMGKVRLDERHLGLHFDDDNLGQQVERLEIGPIVQKAVVLVSQVWGKLTNLLSASDIKAEQEKQADLLEPISRTPSRGMER